jgi:hypothetical protein
MKGNGSFNLSNGFTRALVIPQNCRSDDSAFCIKRNHAMHLSRQTEGDRSMSI